MSSTLRFSRTISISPDDETGKMTLAALKTLVHQAETLGFPASAEVYAVPSFDGTGEFAISVMDKG